MEFRKITAATVEPIDEPFLRAHTKVDPAEPWSTMSVFVAAARARAEHLTGRTLLQSTWDQFHDAFPCNEIRLGKSPVQSVAVYYARESDGAEQLLAATEYVTTQVWVPAAEEMPGPPYIAPAPDKTWPATYPTWGAVRLRLVCGWALPSDVPAEIRHWIAIRAASAIRNREEIITGATVSANPFFDSMLESAYTYWGVG